jgi:hypothetical protein
MLYIARACIPAAALTLGITRSHAVEHCCTLAAVPRLQLADDSQHRWLHREPSSRRPAAAAGGG